VLVLRWPIAQARIEVEALRTVYLELAECWMEGIYQDVARSGQYHTGDNQRERAAGSDPLVADAPESGAGAVTRPVSRQALRESFCEFLGTSDRNQGVGLAQLLHVLDVYELLECGERRVLGAVHHPGTRRIPTAAVIAGALAGERLANETAIDDPPEVHPGWSTVTLGSASPGAADAMRRQETTPCIV